MNRLASEGNNTGHSRRRGFLAKIITTAAGFFLGKAALAGENVRQGDGDTDAGTPSSNIRLNEGDCIELDGKGEVRVRYLRGRIEFLNGNKCVAHINVHGNDHEL